MNTNLDQIPNDSQSIVKLLGLFIDEKLTLKSHVQAVLKKVNKSLFFLSRVRNTLNSDAKKLLYFAHVHSHLIYCLPLLTLLYKTDLNQLCRIQRKAIRVVFNLKQRTSCMNYFHELGTFPLDVLLEKEILKTMQSVHSYSKPKEIAHFFKYKHVTHPYNFRENLVFDIPLIRSVRLSCSPIFSFPFTFNHFPENFKEIMERKEYMEKLDLFHISKFPNLYCNKNLCKFCHYFQFKKRQLQFAQIILKSSHIIGISFCRLM